MDTIEELRDMSDEQLELTGKEAAEHLFRLRVQAQSEQLDTPSELKKQRRLIARVKTIQTQRSKVAGAVPSPEGGEGANEPSANTK